MKQRDNPAASTAGGPRVVAGNTLWPIIRSQVLWIAALFAWTIVFLVIDALLSESPLQQPISLEPPGNIDTNIWIPLRERYLLQLEFSRRGHSFEELKQLIGDWFPKPTSGVPVEIAWSLTSSKTNAVVAQGTGLATGAAGWSQDNVYRAVSAVRVDPGRYRFEARILKPVPQLSSVPAKLSLTNNFKTTDTWQSAALFYGAMFTAWLIVPLTALLALLLLVRTGLHYLRRR